MDKQKSNSVDNVFLIFTIIFVIGLGIEYFIPLSKALYDFIKLVLTIDFILIISMVLTYLLMIINKEQKTFF
jgi:hypothetical protein